MIRVLAAICAAVAIGAGAFGAHVATGDAIEWLRTGAQYLLVHAAAVLWIVGRSERIAAWILGGASLFAVTLFLMALGLPRWLGAVTPVGGLLLIGGWIALAIHLYKGRQA